MDLKQWRASRRATITLPSGLEVILQKVSLQDLVVSGTLPAPLLQEVYRVYQEGGFGDGAEVNFDSPEMSNILEKLPDAIKMFDAVSRAALAQPCVGEVPDDEHITLAELSLEDKEAIFNWASAEVPALTPFRAEPNGDGAAAPSGGELSPAP